MNFPVFPCRPGGKEPLIAGGFKSASSDPRQIAAWLERWPNANWASRPFDMGCIVIDIDAKADPAEAQEVLDAANRVVQTPSGFYHCYFNAEGVAYGNRRYGLGIDVRCADGYVLIEGSTINGVEYTVIRDGEPAPLPEAFKARLAPKVEHEAKPAATDTLDDPLAIERARRALDAMPPLGLDDEAETYPYICVLKDLGISKGTCFDLLTERGDGNDPEWLRGQIANAYKYGQNEPGSHAIEPMPNFGIEGPQKYTLAWWRARDLPQPVKLIGPINRGSRARIIGPTGRGKTHVVHAAAAALASGTQIARGFWTAPEPKTVLTIDGEMTPTLLQERMIEAGERAGDVADRWLTVSWMEEEWLPLNEGGWPKIEMLIEALKPDLVIFDTVRGLIAGDLNDPKVWEPVAKLARTLSKRDIAQIWVHHTNTDGLGYGDKTAEWDLDTIMRLEPGEGDDGVDLKVRWGKRRQHKPGVNSIEYQDGTLKLEGGQWNWLSDREKTRQRAENASGDAKMGLEEFMRQTGLSKAAAVRWRIDDKLYDFKAWRTAAFR